MTAHSCYVVPAAELHDLLTMLLWLPLACVVLYVVMRDWEYWLDRIRIHRRRLRLRIIREDKRR